VDSKPQSKPKVLAVDDVPANLVALDAVLDPVCDVVRANGGREAIAYLEKNADVDVILMDIQMPGMDGYEAARIIKSMPNCKDIPLIFVTAIYTEDPHVKKGYQVGAVDYFSKPFDPDILRLKVGVYASYRRRAAILEERERQIRESEHVLHAARKLSAVLESLEAGIIIADTDGNVCQTNEEVSRIVKSVDAMAADSYGELLGWWDRDGAMLKDGGGALDRALREGVATPNQLVTIHCLDGTTKTLYASTSPLRGLDNAVVGAVIVVQDVTEKRKIEADFEHRITRLISLGVELEQTRAS
jgi:CheY-like chemotaxis protein